MRKETKNKDKFIKTEKILKPHLKIDPWILNKEISLSTLQMGNENLE